MIYDCFLFNSELDLLELRLSFLNDAVDYFVLVESDRTLSGIKKALYFQENKERYIAYLDKIIYLQAPSMAHLYNWQYEYFQRNYIKEGLVNCNDEDVIFISDVDEIVNIRAIIYRRNLQLPALIELPLYYYFFNLQSNQTYLVNLVAEYKFIKDINIGERNVTYPQIIKNIIYCKQLKTGWHFSYLFGHDIDRYLEKISSFSHQEYNNARYRNAYIINKCLKFGLDIFHRHDKKYKVCKKTDLDGLMVHIENLNMLHLIYKRSFWDYADIRNIQYLIQNHITPSVFFFMRQKIRNIKFRLRNFKFNNLGL